MSNCTHWQSGTALMLALGLTAGAVAPIVAPTPAFAQSQFVDVSSDYWAERFISDLAARDVIAGFPDGSFRPNEPVTRAQYAAMVRKAFNKANIRNPVSFVDVASSYWATPAINEAYTTGFLTGYPGNVFRPNQNIPRAQVLVSLANGLNYSASNPSNVQFYNDAVAIPDYAVSSIAAATENEIVVNYPNVRFLNPNQVATRADVAAFIYQALSSEGQAAAVNSPYIVSLDPAPAPAPTQLAVPAGTTIPTAYDEAEKIVLLPEETVPLTLTVQQTLTSSGGQVVMPAGSRITGELRPVGDGSQFIGQELILANGQRFPISASSQVLTETETIRKGVDAGRTVASAAVGSGAAAAIAGVTGDRRIDALEVLAGTAAGTLAGVFLGRQKVEVIAINPDTDLNLTLDSNLVLPVQ